MVIKKNIPQLRFPEFEGEYEKRILNDTCTIVGGGTPDSGKEELWNGHIQWFTPTEIKMDYVSKSERTITELGLKKSSARILPKGTILLTSRATIGEVAIALNECTTNQGFQSLIVNKLYNNLFIFNWIKNNRYQFVRRANGSTFLEISKSEIGKIPICTPTLPEQQKIASFFTAIDQKITQLKRKLTLLEQYKKGVMQLIFSQEIRFKDDGGQEYPKWEKKRLGEIAEVKRGAASNHLKYVNDESKGIRLLRINDFLSDDAVYVEDTDDIKRFRVRRNDLLIAGTGATAGIVFIVPEKFDGLSYSYNAPRIRVTNAFHTFIYHYLKSDIILKQQKRLFVGNAQTFLDTDVIRGFKINLPSDKEQVKIANFLSAIDNKIDHTQKQIEKAEVWKKGLMQQMFV
jgi:type I restriction enzyme S subunit